MALFANSLGFLPPYFGSGLGSQNFGFIKNAAAPSPNYIIATGGIITRDGDYLVHTFNSDGTFEITNYPQGATVWALVVGGGGGGGSPAGSVGSGGGGAGGFLENLTYTPSNGKASYSITIGSGGSGVAGNNGTNGSNSVFDALTAIGGGGGSAYPNNASNGGSGGGAAYNGLFGNGTVGQGNNGGLGTTSGPAYGGGGGGGAGAVGQNGTSSASGNGGDGLASSIIGTSTYYAGGGGSGARNQAPYGTGGLGGGGNGGNYGGAGNSQILPIAGNPNTGGGGGGCGTNGGSGAGANGGSGVVIVRYYSPASGNVVATGGIVTRDGDYLVHTFNGDGTFTVTNDGGKAAMQVLVVGGGGGGGGNALNGGGGGAGGFITNTFAAISGANPVVIGSGGAFNTNGGNTTFLSAIAFGGGRGGYNSSIQSQLNGSDGGSGGGAGAYTIIGYGGSSYGSQGNKGGNSTAASPYGGGGGGGAGAVGGNVSTNSGNGGVGLTSSISGVSVYYAGGGGGGTYENLGLNGNGGNGGGGAGAYYNTTAAVAGLPNTGGGGGGGSYSASGGKVGANGGSGTVIVRYYSPQAAGYINATGGTITTVGNMRIHTFTGDGTFTITNYPKKASIWALVIAGGGGGGGYAYDGGGGAGGYREFTNYVPSNGASAYSISVGSGGNGGANAVTGNSGANGGNSVFDMLTSIGGGGGGGYNSAPVSGGSGGGGSYTYLGASGTSTQGNSGGNGMGNGSDYRGGGGGGAGAVGLSGASLKTGGNGGNGKASSITSISTYYAGGGAGGAGDNPGANYGSPGLGGGGGAINQNGNINTGGGGAGSLYPPSNKGGNGGSGVVIIAYQYTDYFNSNAQTWLNALTTKPSLPFQIKVSDFYTSLQSGSNNYSKHDSLWVRGLEYQDNATTDLILPSRTSSIVGTPTFTAIKGFIGAANSGLDWNWSPSSGVQYTNLSGCVWAYITLPNEVAGFIMGTANVGSVGATGIYVNNNPSVGGGVNGNGLPLSYATTGDNWVGLVAVVRNGSTQELYINGVLKNSVSGAAFATPTGNMVEMIYNYLGFNPTYQAYVPGEIFATGAGSGSINQTELYNSVKSLYSSLPLYEWYGDSLFYGTGATIPTNAFSYLISTAKGFNILNRGVPGQTTTTFLSSKVAIRPCTNSASKLFFDWGVNDSVSVAVGTYQTNCQTIIDAAVAAGWSKSQIYWYTNFIASDGPGFTASNYLTTFVSAIKTVLAANPQINEIDVSTWGYSRADYIHLNDAGNVTVKNNSLSYI